MGILLEEFKDVKPNKYITADRAIFAFRDDTLCGAYIVDLTEKELEAIHWKYLR